MSEQGLLRNCHPFYCLRIVDPAVQWGFSEKNRTLQDAFLEKLQNEPKYRTPFLLMGLEINPGRDFYFPGRDFDWRLLTQLDLNKQRPFKTFD